MSDHKTLEILGSGEFEPWTEEMDRLALSRARAGDGTVAILPAASAPEGDEVFDAWARMGLDHYRAMGVPSVVVPMKTREDGYRKDLVALLEPASMIFFSGGNPAYLSTVLRDTPFWDAVVSAVDRGVALAGCSAGACIIGEIAPDSSQSPEKLDANAWQPGLRVMPGVVFGPHWDVLDVYRPGLTEMFRSIIPPGVPLVRLDEGTAILGDGEEFQVFGRAEVGVELSGGSRAFHAGDAFSLSSVTGELTPA